MQTNRRPAQQPDELALGDFKTDRVGHLETDVAQLKDEVLKARQEILNLEAVARDTIGLMLQLVEANKATAITVGKLSAHVAGHDADYAASIAAAFCPYCTPLEG